MATDDTHRTLVELENVFPESPFLKTQRALLAYHCKGMLGLSKKNWSLCSCRL